MNKPPTEKVTRSAAAKSPAQISNRGELQQALAAPHQLQRRPLGELLVNAGLITPDRIETLIDQRAAPGIRLGEALTMAKAVQTQDVFRSLSEQLGVPFD